jgi:hypothetical protein
MIAHSRDADRGPVCVSDASGRGASRHQQGVVELENWGREVADVGGPSVERQKQQVARAGFEAGHGLWRNRVFQQHDLNPDTRCKRPSNLYPHTLWLASCRGLDVLRQKEPDSNLAGLHDVGDPRVRDPLRVGDGRTYQQSDHHGGT